MIFLVAILGAFLGRLFIGGTLNFFLKPEEHENPNPENYLGYIGSAIGIFIAIWIYKS
jgi:hypothetical protein